MRISISAKICATPFSALLRSVLHGREPSSPEWPQVLKPLVVGKEPGFSKDQGMAPSFTEQGEALGASIIYRILTEERETGCVRAAVWGFLALTVSGRVGFLNIH